MVLHLPDSWPNRNLEMLVFEERGKPEYQEKNLSEQRREPTTNWTHIWPRRWDLNPGHIGGRWALSPLHYHLLTKGATKGFLTSSFSLSLIFFYSWEGEGDTEVGKDKNTGKVIVRVNPKFYRPTEVVSLAILLWHPHKHFCYLYYIRHFWQMFHQ